jgi:hypothetical protein
VVVVVSIVAVVVGVSVVVGASVVAFAVAAVGGSAVAGTGEVGEVIGPVEVQAATKVTTGSVSQAPPLILRSDASRVQNMAEQ